MTTADALRKLAYTIANGSLFWPAYNTLRRQNESLAENALAFIAGCNVYTDDQEENLATHGAEHYLRGRLFAVINGPEDRVNLVDQFYEWAVQADDLMDDELGEDSEEELEREDPNDEHTRCGSCGGEKDSEGWCPRYCEDISGMSDDRRE